MTADLPPSSVPRLVDPAERVVELLAIALFDQHWRSQTPIQDAPFTQPLPNWWSLTEAQRSPYRRMARGEEPLP